MGMRGAWVYTWAFLLFNFVKFKLFTIFVLQFKPTFMSQNQEQNFNAADMAAKQKEIMDYYQSQIPFLEAQKQYETLITELQELEARRAFAAMKIAQIMAPAPKEGEPEMPEQLKNQPRTLRKEQ
jgi:hypothetical protein